MTPWVGLIELLVMETGRSRYFQSVLDAIDAFKQAGSQDVLGNRIAKSMAGFGYEHYCFMSPSGVQAKAFTEKVMLQNWPKGWFQQYVQSNFHPKDPVASFCRSQVRPFPWSSVPIPDTDPMAQEIMAVSSEDYRMRHGYCVPIYGLHGHEATISLAGREIDDDKAAASAVEMISIYAFSSLAQLKSVSRRKALTPREREIVSWTAYGKTSWDISVILSISEDTVNKTMTSAMRKLNAHTRAQAVAESIRLGEIVP
ncbi:MAG: hypothetical protein EOO82_03480 [Oxalobacteraceae bacterium]|nr:MAG: hypothetical protein EOO82_03480 [Oxalobacteraceae bacterium]